MMASAWKNKTAQKKARSKKLERAGGNFVWPKNPEIIS
jgi:hypothetical protein